MKVVLVNPPPPQRIERWDRPDYPHIGLGYLAANLRAHDIPVTVIDGKLERIEAADALERIRELAPDVVGLSAMTHEICTAADLAGEVKRLLPQVVTVVGGVHPTAVPEDTLHDFDTFDYAVYGEGEGPLVELVQALEAGADDERLAAVIGLVRRTPDGVVKHPERYLPGSAELDALPHPAWDLFPRAHTYPVMTVRGCPFTCVFCARPYGQDVRSRSVENILGEFRWLVDEVGAGYIKIYDETFGVKRKDTTRVLDGFIEMGLPGRIGWWAQTRISLAREEMLAHMGRAGCDHVGFGIESGNPEIIKSMSKDVDLEKAQRLNRAAQQAGITTEGFFIIGHPNETRDTAWDTIRFAAALNTDCVSFGVMVPYPGTVVWEMAKRGQGGYRLISTDWRDFNKQLGNALELESLSRPEMERLQLIAYSYFFLKNRRLVDFLKFSWQNRVEAVTFLKRFFPKAIARARGQRPTVAQQGATMH